MLLTWPGHGCSGWLVAGSGGDRDLNGWWWRRHASQLTVTIWYLICFLIYTHNIQQGDQKIAGTKTSSQGQCLSPQCISGYIFVFLKYKILFWEIFPLYNNTPVTAFKPCLSGLKGLTREELELFFQLKQIISYPV